MGNVLPWRRGLMQLYYDDRVLYRALLDEYITIEKGEGIYLYDSEGRRYLDACGQGAGCIISIGYGVAELVEAMAEQAHKIAFLHGGLFRSDAFTELADRVVEMAPEGLTRVWLSSGGSEAVESALKLARQYHLGKGNGSKYRFVARWLSFHGATTATVAMTGLPGSRQGYEPLLQDFPHIVPCYCYRCPFDKAYPECDVACADDLEREILQSGPETIAAFIAEPITLSATVGHVPPPEYFPRIRQICDKYDVLLVIDCVQTGFGRTGNDFAISHWGVVPDIIAFNKGVSGGYYPLGGIIVSDEIIDILATRFKGRFHHGHAYAGNPLGAAVGAKVLEIIKRENLVSNAKQQGEYLKERLEELSNRHPTIGEVRGLGLAVGAELVKDRASKQPFPREANFSMRLAKAARERGLLISAPSGNLAAGGGADQLRLTPPMVISQDELDVVVDVLGQALTQVEEQVL
jgi:adenosylmethionine-8-amino-7-oxononanoate aminotransferase